MIVLSAPVGAREKTYTPGEIFSQIRQPGLSKAEVVKILGEPDFKGTYKGQDLWQYYDLTAQDKGGKVWHQYFLFDKGHVSYDWVTDTKGPPTE
jgi:outer membrane protein assembly factor BamE (lipoprotein component of BamABCDE complex)